MKTTLLSAFLLTLSLNLFADIHTVSNSTANPGQYTTIQDAINAASAGDTVYIHGSSVYYSPFSLDRQLTIIGPGFQPSSTNLNASAIVTGLSGVSNINASGSKIIGIYFISGFTLNGVSGLHDFTIARCWMQSQSCGLPLNGYNIIIAENYFWEFGLTFHNTPVTAHDILVTNNVFKVGGGNLPFSGIHNATNFLVSNNLFYGVGTPSIASTNGSTNVSSYGITFANNIFNGVAFTNLSSSTFSNCLTFNCNGDTPWITNGTDLGSVALGTQNIANTSPNFINQASINVGGNISVEGFDVNPGSPALSSMAGDPLMGPYGGSGAYNFRRASASNLPFVYSLTISNPTIQSGSNLNIDVIGKKHD